MPVFSGGRWQWRERLYSRGKRWTGGLRATQEEVYADYAARRQHVAESQKTAQPDRSLGACLDAVADRAKKRRDPKLVEQDTGGAVRYMKTTWRADTPMERIDDGEFDRLVTKCLDAGRHPSTIRRYVRILNAARAVADFPGCSPTIPRGERRAMELFTPEELVCRL